LTRYYLHYIFVLQYNDKQMETYNYNTAKFNVGDSFSITHSDGFVAHEVVAKVINDGFRNYYVCESAAVYSDDNF
jgi:hypothetical protein